MSPDQLQMTLPANRLVEDENSVVIVDTRTKKVLLWSGRSSFTEVVWSGCGPWGFSVRLLEILPRPLLVGGFFFFSCISAARVAVWRLDFVAVTVAGGYPALC
ncbi:hypothetical protein Ancab_034132 [Ancistrocladus abbreviatus]